MGRLVSKEKLEMAKLLVEKNGEDLVEDSVLKNLKLGQLEDIEEELGIDLITLFKCKKGTKVYVRGINDTIIETEIEYVRWEDFLTKYDENACCHYVLRFATYGKTWALTKNELTKE